jgi:antitoxin (DNA-binding transcriptional repressor) of toxin-antitoxin stability system
MKKVTLEKVQARLGDYVASSVKHPVLILRDGEPVAMLVGLNPKNQKGSVKLRDVLERAWKEYEQYGGIPHEEFWTVLRKERGRSTKAKRPTEGQLPIER